MKKLLLLLSLLLYMFINVQAQSKLQNTLNTISDVLNAASQAINQVQNPPTPPKWQQLANTSVIVNSISKAYLGGGHTRQVVPIPLPQGTYKVFYRITVMEKGADYPYAQNESFYYDLVNRIQNPPYQPTTDGVDFFLLGSTGDADSFSETGNNNFRYYADYERDHTNSFFGYISNQSILSNNLWIGIRNDNKAQGLQVIVEVVGLGYYQ